LLLFSLTGFVDKLAKLFTQSVVRGIQLAIGLVFLRKGIDLIVDRNQFLSGVAGMFPDSSVNLIMGLVVFAMVLLLLDNKKLPAAIAAVGVGIVAGFALGGLGNRSFTRSLKSNEEYFVALLISGIALAVPNMA
jgi:SulP family sulfate permease